MIKLYIKFRKGVIDASAVSEDLYKIFQQLSGIPEDFEKCQHAF